MKGIIDLADVRGCPDSITAFYFGFGRKITALKTIQERGKILSDMVFIMSKDTCISWFDLLH